MYKINNPTIVAPGILVYDNVIEDTNKIINLALSVDNWFDSEVYTEENGQVIGKVKKDKRSSRNLSISHNYYDPIEWFELYQIIWRYADNYGKFYDISFAGIEGLQIIHYKDNNNFYTKHCDEGKLTSRLFSMVLYLNDVREGGETYFNNFDIKITPKSGRLLMFPSNYPYVHEARPPINSEKFIIVTWANFSK